MCKNILYTCFTFVLPLSVRFSASVLSPILTSFFSPSTEISAASISSANIRLRFVVKIFSCFVTCNVHGFDVFAVIKVTAFVGIDVVVFNLSDDGGVFSRVTFV